MALGGAFTALSNDPSAIYFNAAGITQLSGTHFMLGTTLIAPESSFRGVYPSVKEYKTEKQTFFPTHFYATHSISKKLAVGLGFTTPFGLGTKWGDNWVGKYLALKTELMVFTVSPVVAYKLSDEFSVSAGFVYSFANVTITQKTPQSPFVGDAYTELTGKEKGAYGYNLGVMYKPTKNLSFGASFHSEIKYSFKGTASTTGASQLAAMLPNGDATANLKTPFNLAVGVAYRVIPKLLLSADFQYVGWSSYDTLKVDFASPTVSDIASPRMYDNSFIIRLGGEYTVSNKLAVQAGIYFDKNPVKPEYLNPSLPDANRLGFSAGVGYKLMPNLSVNAAYLFIRASQLTVTDSKENYTDGIAPFNGTYNSFANLMSVTLSYSL
jgi:long-chain fatty acid transport protein